MIETLVVGQMATNCFIVDDAIIDPGDDAEYIISHLTRKPKMIVATHGHFDHVMAGYALQKAFDIPFYLHRDDFFLLARMQSSARHYLGIDADPPPVPTDIDTIPFIHTPGHTPGSICLPVDDILIVGDSLFASGMVGRTDFSYSDPKEFQKSLAIIRSYPKKTRILPGHGKEFRL